MSIVAVDLFCGIGGLTRGLINVGINVVAGYDIDETCRYAYEINNKSKFINMDIKDITADDINSHYNSETKFKILVGCAPCQPFSMHNSKLKKNDASYKHKKWGLLYFFSDLVSKSNPDIISMENVPNLANNKVFVDFVSTLKNLGYEVNYQNVYCPDYGIAQNRRRLVLLASKFGEIKLISPTHTKEQYVTLKDVIGKLPLINAGETYPDDKLHKSSSMSELTLKRIRASKPGGTWADWPEELRTLCHKKEGGQSYKSVYGRLCWNKISSTITTQFYNYGTGRYGHPEIDRALSLREGAIIQSFPIDYKFVKPGEKVIIKVVGRQIGNAVPVKLGEVIGLSIKKHIDEQMGENKKCNAYTGR